jgi:leucyl/phenylalanyl-tRNA--protein transferase
MTRPPRSDPGPTSWDFGIELRPDANGLIAVGADLEPSTLIAAYRRGLFPMNIDPNGANLGWWSPDPRGIIVPAEFRVHRSMRRALSGFRVLLDHDFRAVVMACMETPRPSGWITPRFVDAYETLYEMGWAHSVGVYRDEVLVGGLYGVSVGGLFSGESMFHSVSEASKVAMWAVVHVLSKAHADVMFDVQWLTPHLSYMGGSEIARQTYLDRLFFAVDADDPFRAVEPGAELAL